MIRKKIASVDPSRPGGVLTIISENLLDPILTEDGDGGFNGGAAFADSGWTAINGSEHNAWYLGPIGANGSGRGAYISGDGGTSNTYDNIASRVHLIRDVEVPSDALGYIVSFDVRVTGEGANFDVLRLHEMPQSTTPVAGTDSPGDNISGSLHTLGASFVRLQYFIQQTGSRRINFQWRNDVNNQPPNQPPPPPSIDNVRIEVVLAGDLAPATSEFTLTRDGSVAVLSVDNSDHDSWVIDVTSDGFFSLQAPDSTIDGGNPRGNGAIDLQTLRSSPDQVASGNGSIIMASLSSRASGTRSVVIASSTAVASGLAGVVISGSTASGSSSFAALGGTASGIRSVAIGDNASSSVTSAFAFGPRASADLTSFAYAQGRFSSDGDAQFMDLIWRRQTTGDTTEIMTFNGLSPTTSPSSSLVIPQNTTIAMTLQIVAKDINTGEAGFWVYTLGISRDGAESTVRFLGQLIPDKYFRDDPAWDVDLSVNTTNALFEIEVTGGVNNTIRWVASARITRVQT